MVEPKGTGGQLPQSQPAASDLRHEPIMTDVRGIVRWMIVFALLIVVALVLCFVVMSELSQRLGRSGDMEATARAPALHTASPGLEFNSTEPLRKLRAREEQLLHQAGWVDRQEGVARIPIDEAMRIVVDRAGERNGEEPQNAADEPASSKPKDSQAQEQ